jgi:dolichol-phosphate mannosyltransferase
MAKISVVIPCYYNEKNIPVTSKTLIENEKQFGADVEFEYVMVDDGSKDDTYGELLKFREQYPDKVIVIKLSKNFGANNACLCGLNNATGDCVVTLAADLQDPPELIVKMYEYWLKGFKIVSANRSNREEGLIQKAFSGIYHTLMTKFAITDAPKGGADLFLLDKQVYSLVVKMDEKNTSLPYLFFSLGFDSISIPYVRKKREIGKSTWTTRKKIKAFVDAFVSFSFVPIRIISIMGIFTGLMALAYSIIIIIEKLTGNVPTKGWSSMMIVILFVSSFQMIGLGIIGEYLWRTLDAARKRPNFIIDKKIDETKK